VQIRQNELYRSLGLATRAQVVVDFFLQNGRRATRTSTEVDKGEISKVVTEFAD
jgi:hypothetical protein